MKKIRSYTDAEMIKITAKYGEEIYGAARLLYTTMPWTFLSAFVRVIEYVTNPTINSVFEASDEMLYETEPYEKYSLLKEIGSKGEYIRNMIENAITCEKEQNFTIRRIKALKTLKKKSNLGNIVFYTKIYGSKNDTYEALKQQYRDTGSKQKLKEEFLNYIKYTNIDKQRKQSKRYTVSRDLDRDVYYETTEGRLAKIKGYLFKKYQKKCKIDYFNKAHDVIPEGIIVKPMKLINKAMPKAGEGMKLLLASLFEGLKECHMVIDTDFNKAYSQYYTSHQDTDGDKASNYSCMSGEGDRAQKFYGKIHGCKVVRWELADGEQVGRCLMYEWNGRRHFIRIYGRYEYHRTMINMLEAQMKEGDLFGRNIKIDDIKLKTDMDWNTEAMYLDGNYYGLKTDGDNWYMVAGRCDTDCKTTSGESLESLVEDTCTCEHCGRRSANDEGIWINDYFYCDSECAEEDGWRCCERCGEWEREDDAIWIEGVGYYCCETCAHNAGYDYDNYNNEWWNEDDLGQTDDERYYTTREGAADYYGVDEEEVTWDCDNSCWKRPEQEQEQQTEGEENGIQEQ